MPASSGLSLIFSGAATTSLFPGQEAVQVCQHFTRYRTRNTNEDFRIVKPSNEGQWSWYMLLSLKEDVAGVRELDDCTLNECRGRCLSVNLNNKFFCN
jgi:hypothetical protein